MLLIRSLAVVLIAASLGAGCGSQPPEPGAPLTVSAAASLREVLPAIDDAPRYNFAGSDALATQIREGAPVDVYAAASDTYPQQLFAEGRVEVPVTFASNRLVLVVPRDNPAGITTVDDVAKPGTKLVIAGAGVPVGDYTRLVLANLKLTRALDNVVSNEQDVKGVVGKVALGEADAGFVYATDAMSANGVIAITIPMAAQPRIEYQVAVVASSANKDAARAFVARLTGPDGQAVLLNAGFSRP